MENQQYKKWLKIENKAINAELKSMTDEQISSAFLGELAFGTAGLRGIMALGTNRINDVNVCRLANAILSLCKKKKLKSVVVGFDTRHNSKKYSRIFAKVLSNGGIEVNLFKDHVPTPVLTYSIKHLSTDLGIMITASHNKKEYNGIKVSTKDGIQISGDLEKELGILYSKTNEVEAFNKYSTSKNVKKYIHFVKEDVKKSFMGNFYKNKLNKALNIIYTPLNGTAYKYVMTALKGVGFKNIVTPNKQKFGDGNFR